MPGAWQKAAVWNERVILYELMEALFVAAGFYYIGACHRHIVSDAGFYKNDAYFDLLRHGLYHWNI